MVTAVKEFSSLGDFLKSVDEELGDLRKTLGELLRRLEDLRIKVEQERKIKEILTKLGGGTSKGESQPNVVELKSLKLMMNPTALQEVQALEEVVESLNNKITRLQAVKKDLEVLGGMDIELKITVIYHDEVPSALMIKVI